MRRIGLTQRVEVVEATGEVRDCLDRNWSRLLREVELLPIPLASAVADVESYAKELQLDGVIFSGGNDLAEAPGARTAFPERDRFESELLGYCEQAGLPVLGVCRGLQLLCLHHGSRLRRVEDHAGTRHVVISEGRGRDLWPDGLEVNSFHDYAIELGSADACLAALARDEAGFVEAVSHLQLPHLGIMWHPERELPFASHDLTLLRRTFSR